MGKCLQHVYTQFPPSTSSSLYCIHCEKGRRIFLYHTSKLQRFWRIMEVGLLSIEAKDHPDDDDDDLRHDGPLEGEWQRDNDEYVESSLAGSGSGLRCSMRLPSLNGIPPASTLILSSLASCRPSGHCQCRTSCIGSKIKKRAPDHSQCIK